MALKDLLMNGGNTTTSKEGTSPTSKTTTQPAKTGLASLLIENRSKGAQQPTYTAPKAPAQPVANTQQEELKNFSPTPFKPTGEVLSAQKDSFAESLFDKLPRGAQTILSSLKESVFGAPVRGTSQTMAGLLRDNPLIPFLTRSPEESTKLLEEELVKRGIEPTRAANIAIAEYQQKQGADLLTQSKIDKELALSDEEKSAVSFRKLMGTGGLALDAMGILPVGVLAKAKNVATMIAKTTDEAVITKLLKENIPNITDDVAEESAVFFKEIKDPDSVETALNKLNYRFNSPEARPAQEIAQEMEQRLVNPKTYDDYTLLAKERPEVMSKADKEMLETLTEVRKYPTLREYEDTFDVGYHGGEKIDAIDLDKSNYAKTFFISDKPEYASEYAGKYKDKGTTNKVFVSKDAKLLDIKNAPQDVINEIKRRAGGTVTGKTITIQRPDGTYFELPEVKDKPESGFGNVDIMDAIEGAIRGKAHFAEAPGLVQIYKDMGYDGMVTYEDAAMRGKNIGIWNKEKLQTESQIKDTWNKAHDKTPELKQPEQPLDFQFGEPKKTIEDTVSEVQKDYTGKRERKWTKKSATDVAKSLGSFFELPAVFFKKRGLEKTIYDPIHNGQMKAQIDRTNIFDKFIQKGLFDKGGVFELGGFKMNAKESENMGKYMLARQGKGYPEFTFDKLTKREQDMVTTFDEVIKELEPKFRKAADDVDVDVGKVDNYAPLMTKDDIKVVDDGIMPQWLLPYEVFGSTKKRVDEVPIDLYETDYRKVMQRWIHGITDFINVAPETNRVSKMLDTEAMKNTLTDADMKVVQKFVSDITTPDVPKTDAGKMLTTVNRWARRGQAVSALGYNIATIMKQALAVIPATIAEKAPPKMKSAYAEAFGVNVKNLPSISIRAGDINAFNDIRSGSLLQLPLQPLKKTDQKVAEKLLNGFLDKEWKAAGGETALSPETMAHIEREAQKTLDMWIGGYYPGQRPPAYTSEIGNTLLMFTYPLISQLNGFFYHVYKGKTGADAARRTAEALTSIAVIAYMEQVIANLSFDWDDGEDMTKDVIVSASGNIPILGGIAYSLANPGVDYSPIPVVSNFNRIREKYNEGKYERTAWETAHLFGVPKSVRRVREGVEVIAEEGVPNEQTKKKDDKYFEVATVPEQVRTIIGGKYGSLEGKEYLEGIGKTKVERLRGEDKKQFNALLDEYGKPTTAQIRAKAKIKMVKKEISREAYEAYIGLNKK